MPIGEDINAMLREANEAYQDFRSELSNLGMSAADFGAAALDHTAGVAVATAFPCDTFEPEVILSPCRPAMDGLHSVNSAKLCLLPLSHGHS